MKWCLNWASFYPCKIELLSTVFGYSCRWMKSWETNCLHGIRFSYGQKWVSTLMTGRCEVVKHYVSKKNICEIILESLIKYESWTQFTSQFSLNAKDIDKPRRKKKYILKKKKTCVMNMCKATNISQMRYSSKICWGTAKTKCLQFFTKTGRCLRSSRVKSANQRCHSQLDLCWWYPPQLLLISSRTVGALGP